MSTKKFDIMNYMPLVMVLCITLITLTGILVGPKRSRKRESTKYCEIVTIKDKECLLCVTKDTEQINIFNCEGVLEKQ